MNTRGEEALAGLENSLDDATRSAARFARQRVDGAVDTVTNAMDGAAHGVRENARAAGDALSRAGRGVAAGVAGSAGYLRDNDAREMFDDVRGLAKKHPGVVLIALAVVGFLLGRKMKSAD